MPVNISSSDFQGGIMNSKRCAAKCSCTNNISRRLFLQSSAATIAGTAFLTGCSSQWTRIPTMEKIRPCGPASSYTPTLKAAFVRRQEEYGMWWPGAVYDGKAAQKKYTEQIQKTAKQLGIKLDLRDKPIYNIAQAEQWVAQAEQNQTDGLILIMLDRQQHSWPTARIAAKSKTPTVIFSPLGTSFTTNTVRLAEKPGSLIYSTVDDFTQTAFAMKMLKAGAKIKQTRCVVLAGDERYHTTMPDLGIQMQYIPAKTFLDEYDQMNMSEEITRMAKDYTILARKTTGATKQDVINGIKSYCVARNILKREHADAITMDCLGTLADAEVSLPCIAWSRMNDDGVPAACEADWGAVASHVMVQYLFDRPGFQQDPVADTATDSIIGAHCSCPTRLNGFDKPSEPFELIHHHGNRDAVPRTLWKPGKRITSLDVLPSRDEKPTEVLISEGTVLENISVPPAGGCVVSVRVKFDGDQNVLTFPGFHQLFFYGEYAKKLKDFCQLYKLNAKIV